MSSGCTTQGRCLRCSLLRFLHWEEGTQNGAGCATGGDVSEGLLLGEPSLSLSSLNWVPWEVVSEEEEMDHLVAQH